MKALLITFLLFQIAFSTDYHGYLYGNDGQYNGEFNFNQPTLNTTPFESYQLRHKESLESYLIRKIKINLNIEYEKYIHIKITDPEDPERWEAPPEIINSEYSYNLHKNIGQHSSLFNLIFTNESDVFTFELRDENNITFYTFSNETFLFSDRYLHFESLLTSNDIYGFGERSHEIKLGDGIFTIWPNDTGGIQKDYGNGGKNGYSHQPVAIHKTKIENIWLGFVFMNINNQDVVIKSYDDFTKLTHKTIGGIIDYYIIVDSSPENVIKNIQFLLGYPFLPPYWSIGLHQSRYGYDTDETFKDVYDKYRSYDIPIDTMWIDIDSLDDFEIFTLNKQQFGRLPSIIEEIHRDKSYFVPIVDIGVAYRENGIYSQLGKKLDIFLKSNYTKKDMVIKVWPGDTLIPDFLNPNTTLFWQYGLKQYYDLVHYDGIWLDMNEVANLNKEAKCIGEEAEECDKEDNYYYYDDLPYLPGYDGKERTNMAAATINENGILTGNNPLKYSVYNVKPMIPYLEIKETYNFIKNGLGNRPFILSRSDTIGSGKYTSHWLGDNDSSYESMKNSLNGIFQFDIFGIPMTSDDICGFFGDANAELCVRWYNLGVFYPFTRNHNFLGSIDQYPWSFDTDTRERIKKAIDKRFGLLRYIYSRLFETSLNEKVGFFNPVFFNFPNDPESYRNMDEKAMIGDAFILFPFFTSETNDIEVIFPPGKWNYYPDGKLIKSIKDERNQTLSGSLDIIHLYMRGGYIIPVQERVSGIKNSYEMRMNQKTSLIINPDENRKANGVLFFDNDDVNTISNKQYIRVDLNYENYTMNVNSFVGDNFKYNFNDNLLGVIEIWGETIDEKSEETSLKCKMTIYKKEGEEEKEFGPYTAEGDNKNDKFYYDFGELKLNINEIDRVEFTFEEIQ